MKKFEKRKKRQRRVGYKLKETSRGYSLNVTRSNKYIYGQVVDLSKGETVVSFSDRDLTKKDLEKIKDGAVKMRRAFIAGQILAEKAIKKGIKEVVFNRSGYNYHGRVKSFAEGARKGELIF
jgi:large subunit ribosomal protein L18